MSKVLPNDIFQYSLLSAHAAGLTDGGPPVAFITSQGNHGIGIFEIEEDEEDDDSDNDDEQPTRSKPQPNQPQQPNDLIQLDGTCYSVTPTGTASPAAKDDSLPFVMTTTFQPTQRLTPRPGANLKQLREQLSSGSSRHNTPLAIRITGAIRYLHTNSETHWDIRGTVFGFSMPAWQAGISGEGLRCCFLSEDKKVGGRVVELETGRDAVVEWARCGRVHLGLPQGEEWEALSL